MSDLPDTLEQLTARLALLEQRVAALEHTSAASPAEQTHTAMSEADAGLSFAQAGGAFSVLGRAMLGIAGAYLLRAVAESSSLPKLAIAAVAIVYAILWLVAAARVEAGNWLRSTVYAGTSALILAPMLWELTLSFKVLPATATAAILAVFVATASALAWKQNRTPIFWVAYGSASSAAIALSIATHELLPFIATLLLMALLCESAAVRKLELSVRPLVAMAADVAIWALIFVYSGQQSTREDYPLIGVAGLLAPGCVLFLIYAAAIAIRTAVLGLKITVFETGQALIAIVLAAASLLYFVPQAGVMVLGVACLILAAACYAAAFALFDDETQERNHRVFSSWAAALLLAGSMFCLPQTLSAVCLGVAAIIAIILGARFNRLILQLHGVVFLLAAAIQSAQLKNAFDALAGSPPATLVWGAAAISVCAIVCYVAARPAASESGGQRLLRLAMAAMAVWAVAALVVQGLLWLAAMRMLTEACHVAFFRTLGACALALALAFAGSHWRRVELTRIAYAVVALVAVKLVFEDMRHGRLEFIAASIFLFAITLIAVPRLARAGQRMQASA